jgi:hypothetical protein
MPHIGKIVFLPNFLPQTRLKMSKAIFLTSYDSINTCYLPMHVTCDTRAIVNVLKNYFKHVLFIKNTSIFHTCSQIRPNSNKTDTLKVSIIYHLADIIFQEARILENTLE